jgi:hypothetical protein
MGLGLGAYTIMVRQDSEQLRDLGLAVEFCANALQALADALPRQERRPLLVRMTDLRTVKENVMAAVRKLEVQ